MKRYLLLCITGCLLMVLAACTAGNSVVGSARAVVVFETSGQNATVTRGSNRTTPRAGFRLTDRDMAATGEGTTMYLLLNAESVMKMDENSKVEVNAVSANRLTLTLLEGAIAADIKRESPDDMYEIRVGNVMMGVRGTSFLIEYRDEAVTVVMLDGSGEIEGTLLTTGEVAVIGITDGITVEPLNMDNITSPFITNEITRREELQTAYGAGVRITIVAAGAPHEESSVVMEFALMDLYLNEGLHDRIEWPDDGDYELRIYTGGVVSAGTLSQSFSFAVYQNQWRCHRVGCAEGWINHETCECVDELESLMRDWR